MLFFKMNNKYFNFKVYLIKLILKWQGNNFYLKNNSIHSKLIMNLLMLRPFFTNKKKKSGEIYNNFISLKTL